MNGTEVKEGLINLNRIGIPVAVLVSILIAAAGSGWWLSDQFGSLREIQRQQTRELERMSKKLDNATKLRWTRAHMILWFSQCKWGPDKVVCPHPNTIRVPGLEGD